MMKKIISLLLVLFAAGMVSAEETSQYPVERLVRYSFVLTNRKGDPVPNAEFWVRAPVQQTANQLCQDIEASHPYELVADEHGNQTLHFQFENFPGYGREIIRVTARLSMTSDPVEVSIDPTAYLGAAPLMELDNPLFAELAPKFGAGKPARIARTSMGWVQQHLQDAGYLKLDGGALYALKEQRGDCTEYTYLFAALCRAHGIPARAIGGYVSSGNAVLSAAGYHNWAEFFDGERWQVVDPQRGVFAEKGSSYVALCVADQLGPLKGTARFRVKGDGLTARMD